MTSNKDKFLKAEHFERALKRLDHEMGKNDFLSAFAPINVVSAGGFLAVTYFKNREATGDLDYMIDPQWSQDDEIKSPLKEAIRSVAKKERFEVDWMNDGLEVWATPEACKTIFQQAYQQNKILFAGTSLIVWAAPFEWALERKLRRIAFSDRGSKRVDMEDALALFRYFREASESPLDMEHFRRLNMNGFDLVPGIDQMEKIATRYREKYNQDLFSSPTTPAVLYATSSNQIIPTVSYTIPSYATTPAASNATSSDETRPVGPGDWSQWSWNEQYQRTYRYRVNAAETGGYEYEYDMTEASAPEAQHRGSGKGKGGAKR